MLQTAQPMHGWFSLPVPENNLQLQNKSDCFMASGPNAKRSTPPSHTQITPCPFIHLFYTPRLKYNAVRLCRTRNHSSTFKTWGEVPSLHRDWTDGEVPGGPHCHRQVSAGSTKQSTSSSLHFLGFTCSQQPPPALGRWPHTSLPAREQCPGENPTAEKPRARSSKTEQSSASLSNAEPLQKTTPAGQTTSKRAVSTGKILPVLSQGLRGWSTQTECTLCVLNTGVMVASFSTLFF